MAKERIENETRREAVNFPAAAALLPRHGLVSRPYDLSPREFERLKQFDPVFAAAGGAVLSFALTYGLPLIPKWLFPAEYPKSPVTKVDWWIFLGSLAAGSILLIIGLLAPGQRRKVMKNIDSHFKQNPDVLLYRDDLR